jgi:hypothetical protein
MKINEYIELKRLDNDVVLDIDRHITGDEMKNYTDVDSLLEEAGNVICKYRNLVYSLLNCIHIEDCIKR